MLMPACRLSDSTIVRLIAPVLSALALAISAVAQQAATATIEGVVTDPNGAVVPGATVSVRNADTAFTREIISDERGIYRLQLLPPGTYELTVKAGSFAEARMATIQLSVGQKLNLDVQLRVAAGSETMNITAEAPIVETSRPSVSSSVADRQVQNLPVNGRNFLDFVTLTPGVVRDPRGGDLSFGGQRGTLNSVQIDGADNNNNFFGQSLGRTGVRAPYQFSQDAVQEFQVNTNSFSSEFGHAAGGVINVITKSGTNEYHGSAFEFYRDRALNARNLNYNATTNTFTPVNPKQAYHFNQFGGTFGGPIKRDRIFFFVNYDGQRNTQPNILNPLVAAPPDPLSIAGRNDLLQFQNSYTRGLNQDVVLGKVDFQLTPDNRLSVRYNHQNFTGTNFENGGPTRAQINSGNSLVKTDTVNITLNTAFSSKMLNEFRAQIARDREPGTANSDFPEAEVRQSGQSFFIGRNSFSPRETAEKKYQLLDNVSYIAGSHSLKGGVDVIIERIKNFFPGQFGAQYLFNTYADYANNKINGVRTGTVGRFTQAFATPGTTGPTTFPNFNEFGFFFSDDWRPRNNLTVNFGVRYDIQKIRQPSVTNPLLLAQAGIDTGKIHNDYDNIAPRIGFAWKPVGSDRLVVRGGYGIFYGVTPSIAIATATSNNGLNVVIATLNNPTLPFNYPNRFADLNDFRAAGGGLPITNIFYFDPKYQQPSTQQGSFGVEYGVSNDLSVGASWLWVKGSQLQRTRDINLPAPVLVSTAPTSPVQATFRRYPGPSGSPLRPFPAFGRISQFESSVSSNYHGLALTLNKRFSRNFLFNASYTFSKIIDDNPDATGVVAFTDDFKFVQFPTDPGDDRGQGESQTPHRFVANGLWELAYFNGMSAPLRAFIGGWQLSGILQLASNRPFSARLVTDLNNDTNSSTDRAPGYGRNTFRKDHFASVDLRAQKSIYFTERYRLQLIVEFFNILNRVNYTAYNTSLYNVGGVTAGQVPTAITLTPRADFGFPRAAADQRIGQLALKFVF